MLYRYMVAYQRSKKVRQNGMVMWVSKTKLSLVSSERRKMKTTQ